MKLLLRGIGAVMVGLSVTVNSMATDEAGPQGPPEPQLLNSYTELPASLQERARHAQKWFVHKDWNGVGHVMAGRLVTPTADRFVSTRTTLESDGSFCVAVHPSRSLTFWVHGCEPLTLTPPVFTNTSIAWYGDVFPTRLPTADMAVVKGTIILDEAAGTQSDEPITVWLEMLSPPQIWLDQGQEIPSDDWSDIVEMQFVKPGATFTFSGLAPVSYTLNIQRTGFMTPWEPIHLDRGETVDLGRIRLKQAPMMTFKFVARTRWEGGSWQTSPTMGTTNVICNDFDRFHFTELQDGIGNNLGISLSTEGTETRARFFYLPGKKSLFYDLGSTPFDGTVDFDQILERVSTEEGEGEILLQRGHLFFFRAMGVNGIDLECVFAVD